MPSDQKYGSRIRRETSLFANWQPNAPREIGDYGRVNGALFEFFGHLERKEIGALGKRESPSPASYEIMIDSARSLNSDVSAAAGANVGTGKALLQFSFSAADGIVFVAPSVKVAEITSMAALGEVLNQRRREGRWDMGHAVVAQVNVAESATILVSDHAGAGIDFEVDAGAPVTPQLIARLDAGVSVVSLHGVGIRIIGEGPLTPLFKLAYLKRRVGGDPRIVYREAVGAGTGDEVDVHNVDDDHVLVVI